MTDKQQLFLLLFESIQRGDHAHLAAFLHDIVHHNELLKDIAVFAKDKNTDNREKWESIQFREIERLLALKVKEAPIWGELLVTSNLFKKQNFSTMVNELPLATEIEEGKIRLMTSNGNQDNNTGFPDCVVVDKHSILYGLEFKNHKGCKQLKPLVNYKNMYYNVVTFEQNRVFYSTNPSVSKILTYEGLQNRNIAHYKDFLEIKKPRKFYSFPEDFHFKNRQKMVMFNFNAILRKI
jgi:hypothetical protein